MKLPSDEYQRIIYDGKSTLVQVMAWCHQATSHYLSQCWLRSMSPYGIAGPQWVNINMFPCNNCHAIQQGAAKTVTSAYVTPLKSWVHIITATNTSCMHCLGVKHSSFHLWNSYHLHLTDSPHIPHMICATYPGMVLTTPACMLWLDCAFQGSCTF